MGTIDFAILSLAAIVIAALVVRRGVSSPVERHDAPAPSTPDTLRDWCEARFQSIEAALERRIAEHEEILTDHLDRLERKRRSVAAEGDRNPRAKKNAEPEFDPHNKDHLRQRLRAMGVH